MDFVVIMLAAGLGTALGGSLAFLALRKGRGPGAETELHILRERLAQTEAEAAAATVALDQAQRAAAGEARLLEQHGEQVKEAEDKAAALLGELEKQVEKRQALERRLEEILIEREDKAALPGDETELARLRERLDAETRKRADLEAEIASRGEAEGMYALRDEVEVGRERVRELLEEMAAMQEHARHSAATAPDTAEVDRLTSELAAERRLREQQEALLQAAPSPELVERLTAEVARLSATVNDQKTLREDALAEESARVARLSAELTRLAADLEQARARESEVEVASAAEIARLSAEAAQAADIRQRLNAEIVRLSAVVVEQKRLWQEDSTAERARSEQLAAALQQERDELRGRLEEEQRASARHQELLALAQDRMASLFAVFSGDTGKTNGHAAVASPAPQPEEAAVPVA